MNRKIRKGKVLYEREGLVLWAKLAAPIVEHAPSSSRDDAARRRRGEAADSRFSGVAGCGASIGCIGASSGLSLAKGQSENSQISITPAE